LNYIRFEKKLNLASAWYQSPFGFVPVLGLDLEQTLRRRAIADSFTVLKGTPMTQTEHNRRGRVFTNIAAITPIALFIT
jgi:hypothetical protein